MSPWWDENVLCNSSKLFSIMSLLVNAMALVKFHTLRDNASELSPVFVSHCRSLLYSNKIWIIDDCSRYGKSHNLMFWVSDACYTSRDGFLITSTSGAATTPVVAKWGQELPLLWDRDRASRNLKHTKRLEVDKWCKATCKRTDPRYCIAST